MLTEIAICLITLFLFSNVSLMILGCRSHALNKVYNDNDVFGERITQLHQKLKRLAVHPVILPATTAVLLIITGLFSPAPSYLTGSVAGKLNTAVLCILIWKSLSYTNLLIKTQTLLIRKLIFIILALLSIKYFFLLPFVLYMDVIFFNGWMHHSQMCSRIVMLHISFLLSINIIVPFINMNTQLLQFHITRAYLIFLLTLIFSHYLIPGATKLSFGKKWYSWILNDELHYLAASAYSWGWCRFIQPQKVVRFIRLIKPFNLFFAVTTVLIECSCLVMLYSSRLAFAITVSVIIFQLMIFLLSGIFFLANILVLTCVLFVVLLPQWNSSQFFNSGSLIISVLLFLFPLNKKAWFPKKLAWWNAPLTGRLHWLIKGESGKIYELHNDCFGAFERLIGRVYGYFLTHEKIIYHHIGEVSNEDIKRAIVAAGANTDNLGVIKEKYGIIYKDVHAEETHDIFIKEFVNAYVTKKRSKVYKLLTKTLSFPGGQRYYWSEYPKFCNQEKPSFIIVTFKEDYFTGTEFKNINNYVVKQFEVSAEKRQYDQTVTEI